MPIASATVPAAEPCCAVIVVTSPAGDRVAAARRARNVAASMRRVPDSFRPNERPRATAPVGTAARGVGIEGGRGAQYRTGPETWWCADGGQDQPPGVMLNEPLDSGPGV
ncbi:hypothetical protein NUM_36250 [Actinocatenispora comari]|uniref:Uncharacterized protein n=1 Tax=Actinocatenispora comari TaxID=2807577 RepID=A0A8J4ELC9_9ACTN|nr:hypothetical protein NUM_36250 [Actinocatenispora comari]